MSREKSSRTEQDSRVSIVTTCVHLSINQGFIGRISHLLNAEGVHIGAQRDCRALLRSSKKTKNTWQRRTDVGAYLDVQILQRLCDNIGGTEFFAAYFR